MSDSVTSWLEQLDLAQYSQAFADNAIDWSLLPELDQQTLKDIGISIAGHRLRILKSIALLSSDDLKAEAVENNKPERQEDEEDVTAWSRKPGERKPVTMLFADIVGSTAMTENLDAEETHELLYSATRRMADAVESNQGTICRLMGDGIMAMFGAPVASERHALEACRAALDMQNSIAEFSAIQIRVGLASGEVVVLDVGDDPDKPEFDASGPAVPLASRMEQSAEPGTILMTSTTLALAGDLVAASAKPDIKVKGISQPVAVHRLDKVYSAAEVSSGKSRSPFVGRKAELAQFRGLIEVCLETDRGQTVFVRGEAGIGKTRFVEEMTLLAANLGFVHHKALVLDFGTGKGQEAIPALVRGFLGIAPGSGKSEREQALKTAEQDGTTTPEQRVFLNDLLDLAQPLEFRILYDAMDAETRNRGKRETVCDLLGKLATRHPIVVVVEDLHWADETTLEYLVNLTQAVSECPALMVVTSRAEGDPIDTAWRARAGETPIVTWDLSPLRQDESIKLVTAFINAGDELAKQCVERAAGNPLFLEQLLLSIETGSSDNIPDSIKSLVLARMDQLAAPDKQAIRAAAVLGQRFELDALQFLIDDPEYSCETLVEHHLVRPEGKLFLFAHALIQGGSYSSMIKPQRADLHRRAAKWYANRDAILHAEHLEHARASAAAKAYLNAAQIQARQYRPERALQLVRRALAIAPVQESFELRCLEAEQLQVLWKISESIEAFEASVEVASNDIERCRAWVGLAECLGFNQVYDQLFAVLIKAEEAATKQNLTLELARIYQTRGGAYFYRGEIEACLEANKTSLAYAREAASPEIEAKALSGLGDAEYNRGRLVSSYRYFDQCIELSRQHGFGRVIAANLSMRGYVSQWQNNIESTIADYHAAVEQALKTHDLRAEMLVLVAGGAFWASTGNLSEGEKWLNRGLEITRRLGSKLFEGEYHYLLGRIAIQKGELVRGYELAQTAIDILQNSESGMTFGGPIALGVQALACQDPDERQSILARADALLKSGSVGHNYLVFYEDAMEVSLQMQAWDEVDRYAQALEDYTKSESLPRCDYFIARGRALADHGREGNSAEITERLRQLRVEAAEAGLRSAIPALENALSTN